MIGLCEATGPLRKTTTRNKAMTQQWSLEFHSCCSCEISQKANCSNLMVMLIGGPIDGHTTHTFVVPFR